MFYKNFDYSYQNKISIDILTFLDKTIKTIKPIVIKAPKILDDYEKIINEKRINKNIIIYNNLYLQEHNYFINTSTNKISTEQIQRAFEYCVHNSMDEEAFDIICNFTIEFDKLCTYANKPIHYIIIENNMIKTFEYLVNNYNFDFNKKYNDKDIIEFCKDYGSDKFFDMITNLQNKKEIV